MRLGAHRLSGGPRLMSSNQRAFIRCLSPANRMILSVFGEGLAWVRRRFYDDRYMLCGIGDII